MKYIKRDIYVERIKPYIGKPIIKVLTGQRRVGKSCIMLQLCDEVKALDKQANTIYINCELEEFRRIKTSTNLYNYITSQLKPARHNYLFIDEVQEIDSFQDALRSLLAEEKCDIYCTGSNANILSSELATYLSGRYMEFDIHSLSYQEFLQFHSFENSLDSLTKYLTFGGMPFLINLELNSNQVFEYLSNVYSTILLKDVVAKERIRNVSFLENLVVYVADNVGSLFSSNNISKYLKSQQIQITPQLIINYLKGLTNAYIMHKVQRADVGGLKIFEIGEKYYFEDLGLRNMIRGGNASADIHKLMENAVYLHLIQSGYKVFVGKMGEKEIDFMAEKSGKRIYIQVTLTAMDEKTREREFGNLMEIRDNYPKYVVALNDMIIGDDYKGIVYSNLGDFLLKQI
ncbi:ATP-binding protein [Bacteroides sp. 519]|uniref:ATP-binding protein n=1 Tax=Bacteroides sp. 519 TaxID=2302937 RepID=UPI0013D3CAE9|nr:ATP-binding protein [Bacteroides sp. 519]NDV59348.1 ATP-binding protein [Bacteroides sp. 519]